jgi:hypothetical protein
MIAGGNEPRHPVTSAAWSPGCPGWGPYGLPNHRFAVIPSPTPRPRSEVVTQLAVACLGAGVVTSVAVAQGQNPLTALGITLFSAVAAVMLGQVL